MTHPRYTQIGVRKSSSSEGYSLRDEVAVIAADEFRRLSGGATGEALIEAIQASPHRKIEFEPTRTPMPVRGISL